MGERKGEARPGWGGVWLTQVITVAKLDRLLEGGPWRRNSGAKSEWGGTSFIQSISYN